MTYRQFKELQKDLVRLVLVPGVLLAVPLMSYAGVFSFVQDIFVSSSADTEVVVYHNSQTVPLLAALVSPDPDADKGGPEIMYEDDSMLVAEIGILDELPGEYTAATGNEESIYIVRPGDTLGHIAEIFGVTSNTIRWRNDLGAKEYIRAGQELHIPATDGVYHKVAKGDTLSDIAKAYSAEISEIKTFNGIVDASGLTVGEEIFVPGGEKKTVTTTTATKTSTSNIISAPAVVKSSVSSSPLSQSALGEWIWPVRGFNQVTQGYGSTSFAARSGYYKGNHHGGVDIGASTGTEILAAKNGVVTMSQWYFGYGNLVEITHDDGTITRYGHNSKNLVKKGQKVVQGQVIALIGATGRATGPHLHFEIRNADGSQMEHNVFYDTYRNY